MKRKGKAICCAVAGSLVIAGVSRAEELVGTAFSYQGFLEKPTGTPLNDTSTFELTLCDDPAAACVPGTLSSHPGIEVTDGVFTVPDVDFGAGAIIGEGRWMEVSVQCTGDASPVELSPRVELKPAPHALALPGLYTQENATSPNVIGGFSGDAVSVVAAGATISGGGATGAVNSVTADFGTVGGGNSNTASGPSSTVGGGANNAASSTAFPSTVGGGEDNTASGNDSTVGGGFDNTASGQNSTVGGGFLNTASGDYSFAAGRQAKATHAGAFVWADSTNADFTSTANNQFLIRAAGGVGIGTDSPSAKLHVSGGAGPVNMLIEADTDNSGESDQPTLTLSQDGGIVTAGLGFFDASNHLSIRAEDGSGGLSHVLLEPEGNVGIGTATPGEKLDVVGNIHASGTITSGSSMVIDGTTGSERMTSSNDLELHVADGRALRIESNVASPNVVGGFSGNSVTSGVVGATIGGGGNLTNLNGVTDNYGTVGGGLNNQAGDDAGTTSDRGFATVGGGQLNRASGNESTVGGGTNNTASGSGSTVGGGDSNTASGTCSVVAGGCNNSAAASGAFAAGQNAHALHEGAFVWGGDGQERLEFTAPNEFTARTAGGVRFLTSKDASVAVRLSPGSGSWSAESDRNLKENIADVDGREVLERLAAVPIATWNYKAQDPSIRHIGPMGQDFHATFGVGDEPPRINTIDADGVALAAIQGLYEIVKEQKEEIDELHARVEALERATGASSLMRAGVPIVLVGLIGLALLRRRYVKGDNQ